MMRCIQEAFEGGFLTHDEARQLNAEVTEMLRNGLRPDKAQERLVQSLEARANEGLRVALLIEEKRATRVADLVTYKNARGENDPGEALETFIARQRGRAGFQDIETLRDTVIARAHSDLANFLNDFRKQWLRGDTKALRKQYSGRLTNTLDEVMNARWSEQSGALTFKVPNLTGDPVAKAHAQSILHVNEWMRKRLNAAGGHIGRLDYGYAPTNHDQSAVMNAGGDSTRAQAFWVDYLMDDRLNRDLMVDEVTGFRLSDNELRAQLSDIWTRIASDGWVDREPSFSPRFEGVMGGRRALERFIHFKNAQEYADYHEQFGKGDFYDATMQHINYMARDIATMEVLGPKPAQMIEYLSQVALQSAAKIQPIPQVVGQETLKLTNLLRQARGSSDTETDRVLMESVRGSLLKLDDLHRRIGAGGERRRGLEQEMAREVDRLAGMRQDLLQLGLRGVAGEELNLVNQLADVDGEIRALQSQDIKGIRSGRRQRAKIKELTKKSERLNKSLEGMRATHDTLAARVTKIEGDLVSAENELGARPDRYRSGQVSTRTNELRQFIANQETLLQQLRPTVETTRPKLRDEIIMSIDKMRRDIDDLAATSSREFEPAEQIVVALRERLERTAVEADPNYPTAANLIREVAQAIREAEREIRDVRVAQDPDLRPNLVNDLTLLEQQHGDLLDELGFGRQELRAAIEAARQARPLIETPGDFRSPPNPLFRAQRGIERAKRIYSVIRGQTEAVENQWLAATGQNIRNVLTAANLGRTVISALVGDPLFQYRTRLLTGLPPRFLHILSGTVQEMLKADRRDAVRAMLTLDSAVYINQQQAKFTDEFSTDTWSGYFADRVLAIQGLTAATQGGKHAFGKWFQGELGAIVERPWDKLHPETQKTFVDNAIHEEDWDFMRRARLAQDQGALFLRPNEVFELGGEQAQRVGEKYIAMIIRSTRRGVLEGTVRSKAYFRNGGRRGTFPGEILRSFSQFKTFPLQVWELHMIPILEEFQRGNHAKGASQATQLLLQSALAGALITELLQITDFKEPIITSLLAKGEVPGPGYWMNAMLRGGGLGIYGDLAFGQPDRKGSFAGAIAGPSAGLIDRIRFRTFDELGDDDGVNYGIIATETARAITPGQNLWFSKGLTDRMVFAQLRHLFDPDAEKYYDRVEQRRLKKHGNRFFWGPGDFLPGETDASVFSSGSRERTSTPSRAARKADQKLLSNTLRESFGEADANKLMRDMRSNGFFNVGQGAN